MPEIYRNAWYKQLEDKVDEVSRSTDEKIASEVEILNERIDSAIELPEYSEFNNGQVLGVDNGNLAWVTVKGGVSMATVNDDDNISVEAVI